ncbi:TIGR03087 family PEP-CTERM/XrtA system glycosyltransferase [Vibrio ziniensis]|uniref:TIGR03087 family PEP-CTERM/XrtA system glycosyltransferase n=1 Tax=Vibrio ziniensis TaxID=2711221 RepID=A0A6G7CQZ1_9VIBR|nr:TIGR03087 family PEP-CTERM/XrtA system glycosyltransferase [Vibrio ziniensis]QIH44500.1 TIGR03087 family PEP-CTERM/XrtA system glycosyltransferase [Vibrio ziniensis]
MKEKLLYLCHRIPFPANKGDKITTCNILKFLNQHYEIYLGCFIDDPFDQQYKKDVQLLCKEAFFVELNPQMAKIKGLKALFTGDPITLPHYFSSKMQSWVQRTVSDNNIQKALVYSGCMAQYVLNINQPQLHKVMHFADIDSDKWKQYAGKSAGMMRWVYNREHRTLEKYEKHVARSCNISCFISDTETEMFRSLLASDQRRKVQTLGNGLDSEFFSPSAKHHLAENYPLDKQNFLVFTGAMDYWANADAVDWFVKNVWQDVHRIQPESLFYIVGSSPTKEVIELQKYPGVIVTGRVEDVRPYMHYAKASVAPMQIARGIQNKILEAMAMELPVLTTQLGIEGIDDYPTEAVFVSNSAEKHKEWAVNLLGHETIKAHASRTWLKNNYSWEAKLTSLLSYLEHSYEP